MRYISSCTALLLLIGVLNGCRSRNVQLDIYNRSHMPIDSVFIKGIHKAVPLHISPGAFAAIQVPGEVFETDGGGHAGIYIYQAHKRRGSFIANESGIFDFGKSSFPLYVFDHGVRHVNYDFEPPLFFEFFLVYDSSRKPDSLTTLFKDGDQVRFSNFSDSSALIKFPFAKLKECPLVKVSISGRESIFTVEYDWEDWSYSQAVYVIEADGTIKKKISG